MLKSQNISVIWESPETNLIDNLTQLSAANLRLPNLLLVDVQCLGVNPYYFCRWCREHHPDVNVLLTQSAVADISAPEREWAIHQGAVDLLPGFQIENLVSGVTAGVRRALEALEHTDLNDGALISVLLKLKRELESRRDSSNGSADSSASASAYGQPSGLIVPPNTGIQSMPKSNSNGNGAAPPAPEPEDTPSSTPKSRRRYRGISY